MDDFDRFLPDNEHPPEPEHPSLSCPHGKIHVFPYGLRKCLDCGSIEGHDKRWRHADVLWPS